MDFAMIDSAKGPLLGWPRILLCTTESAILQWSYDGADGAFSFVATSIAEVLRPLVS